MKMPETADEALELSIVAWQKKLEAEAPDDIKLGTPECPLCVYHMHVDGLSCNNCPVVARAHRQFCSNTPYAAAYEALAVWNSPGESGADEASMASLRLAWRKAAQAEVDFLISLRKPEGT